jgi:UDP-glucose 4-epimerase
MSPYGNTKQIGEEIITDVAKVSHINAILLRYFNPIGAHPSAEMENYLLGTSKLSTLYYADWVWITKSSLFTAMITQRLTEQVRLYSRS